MSREKAYDPSHLRPSQFSVAYYGGGARGSLVVKALYCKPKGRGFEIQ
jgi:hypothetical protein